MHECVCEHMSVCKCVCVCVCRSEVNIKSLTHLSPHGVLTLDPSINLEVTISYRDLPIFKSQDKDCRSSCLYSRWFIYQKVFYSPKCSFLKQFTFQYLRKVIQPFMTSALQQFLLFSGIKYKRSLLMRLLFPVCSR